MQGLTHWSGFLCGNEHLGDLTKDNEVVPPRCDEILRHNTLQR